MDIQINLLIVAVNWQGIDGWGDKSSGDFYVVSLDEISFEPPNMVIPIKNMPEEPLTLVGDIFEDSVDLNKSWADFYISSAKLDDNVLNITYRTIIPLESRLIDTTWIDITKVSNQHLLYTDLIEALNHIR